MSVPISVEGKIAHLEMIQGVIGRMASEAQTQKTLAITVAAAIIAIAQAGGGVTPWIAAMGLLPTFIFWGLTAQHLHVEKAYRNLYDMVRKDEPVEPFTMNWRGFRSNVPSPQKLLFTPSIVMPFGSVLLILIAVGVMAAAGGFSQAKGSDPNGQPVSEQTK